MSPESMILSTLRGYLNDGWRPFFGTIKEKFRLNTPCSGGNDCVAPFWIYKGDIYLCIGCRQICSVERSQAFIHSQEIQYSNGGFDLTPLEMVNRKHTLLVKEVAYCLNVSESLVYRYIYEGKLIAHKEKPTRVRASDVLELMNDFDE